MSFTNVMKHGLVSQVGGATEMTLFHMTFENTLTPVVNNTVDDITFTNYGLTTLSYQSSYKCEGTYSYRGRTWEIGDYWQWLVNTTGFKDLTFSFGSLVSSTNELSDKLDVRVSPDGTNWTTVIASLIYDNAFICNYNLSDVFPASCNNNTTTYIRIYMYTGSISSLRYHWIDDVKLIGFK